jgi:ferredoxin-type protein NapH
MRPCQAGSGKKYKKSTKYTKVRCLRTGGRHCKPQCEAAYSGTEESRAIIFPGVVIYGTGTGGTEQSMHLREMKCRRFTQLLMLPLLPTVLLGGLYRPWLGFVVPVLIALMVCLACRRGRLYCGWLCPMGAFYERVLPLFSRKKEIPPLFAAPWLRRLILAAMACLLTVRLVAAAGDPQRTAAAFRFMWVAAVSLAVIMGIVFRPRTWCRVCPMGTVQALLGRKTASLQISADCSRCGICRQVCPVSCAPFESGDRAFLAADNCLRCGNCVVSCPCSALSFRQRQ